tara:strand:+ start:133 stop:684 length:552 start_codon:yes stop_codon:yes gene_type:complete
MKVIAEHGTAHLTLRGIAREAGVSHAAPYRHFASKSDLIGSVAAQAFQSLSEYLDERLAPLESPLAKFETLGLAYVEFAAQDHARFQLMFGSELPPKEAHEELKIASDGTYQRLEGIVQDCQSQGLLRAGDPEALALTAWSMSHGMAVLVVDKQVAVRDSSELEKMVRLAAADLYAGLRPVSE